PDGPGPAQPRGAADARPRRRRAGRRGLPRQPGGPGRRMIALVQGEVAVRRPDHVVLLTHGVGYRLAVSAETLKHVPAVGKQATLHAHTILRDDAIALFGFHA